MTPDASRFLLRIVMFAHTSVLDTLHKAKHEALLSRITFGSSSLGPLAEHDLAGLVAHRLAAADGRPGLFTSEALAALRVASGGLPGRALPLAAAALLKAYESRERTVSAASVQRAAAELVA